MFNGFSITFFEYTDRNLFFISFKIFEHKWHGLEPLETFSCIIKDKQLLKNIVDAETRYRSSCVACDK